MTNNYLDFISDKNFENAIINAMNKYKEVSLKRKQCMKQNELATLHKTTRPTDEFRTIFDIYGFEVDLKDWKILEIDSAIGRLNQNLSIKFHLDILTNIKGWELHNIKKHPTHDRIIKNEEENIFINVRNRNVSRNSDSQLVDRRKLEEIVNSFSNSVAYNGYIINEGHEHISPKPFHIPNMEDNPKIMEISGVEIYKIVTENISESPETSFKDTYKALKKYLAENFDHNISESDSTILNNFENAIF